MSKFSSLSDPLSLFRFSIANGPPPTLSNSASLSDAVNDLKTAKYLIFNPPTSESSAQPKPFPLDQPTRFSTKDQAAPGPVDLRTVYFAWTNKDRAIPEYVASAATLGDGVIKNLVYFERLELFAWLEGIQDNSEFITPLAGDVPQASASTAVVPGRTEQPVAAGHREQLNPRLLEIYANERPLGNRNTLLRGEKPTDFSFVRSYSALFVSAKSKDPRAPGMSALPTTPIPLPMPVAANAQRRRLKDPIILLSPSASSLLQMSNIKAFLEEGQYIPPGSSASGQTSLLKISRSLPQVNAAGPTRFALYDSTSSFQPDFWQRVVAVFTTGQAWQFKSYKWSSPPELFRNVRGFYIGWEGEEPPATVDSWKSGVAVYQLDRNRRSRDREISELVWMELERWMVNKGWGR